MRGPAFSICIPNFNHGRYIGETIESVLRQTYQDFEVVVVDNASTDDSVKVIRSFGSERVRLYQNPYNVGFAPNLDRAASKARNDFIIVLSSDDLMGPTALERYAEVITAFPSAAGRLLLASGVTQIDQDGRRLGELGRSNHYADLAPEEVPGLPQLKRVCLYEGLRVFRHLFLSRGVPGSFCTTCYSRKLYEDVGGYSSIHSIGPDAHFAYKALLNGALVAFVDETLFSYRVHLGGQLGQSSAARVLKIPIDGYLFAFSYSDEQLLRGNVARQEIGERVVREDCLAEAVRLLQAGAGLEAFRHVALAFAMFPGIAARSSLAWGVVAGVVAGPIGTAAARAARAVRSFLRRRRA